MTDRETMPDNDPEGAVSLFLLGIILALLVLLVLAIAISL